MPEDVSCASRVPLAQGSEAHLWKGGPCLSRPSDSSHGREPGLSLCLTQHTQSADFGAFLDIVCPLQNSQRPPHQSISLNQQVTHSFVHSPTQPIVCQLPGTGEQGYIKSRAVLLYRPHYLVGKSRFSN